MPTPKLKRFRVIIHGVTFRYKDSPFEDRGGFGGFGGRGSGIDDLLNNKNASSSSSSDWEIVDKPSTISSLNSSSSEKGKRLDNSFNFDASVTSRTAHHP